MMRNVVILDYVLLIFVIFVCGYERNLDIGRLLYCLVIKVGYGRYGLVCNLLMLIYAKCVVNEDVEVVF